MSVLGLCVTIQQQQWQGVVDALYEIQRQTKANSIAVVTSNTMSGELESSELAVTRLDTGATGISLGSSV